MSDIKSNVPLHENESDPAMMAMVRELRARVQQLEDALVETHGFDQIAAYSAIMRALLEQSRHAAMNDSDILIIGENGSGKEMLARAIHFASSRKKGPFIVINCNAIPEALLESELFGNEKTSSASVIARRAGGFERAAGGTLLLDEISELRPHLQEQLLRSLENREIRRIDGECAIKVNTRIISTTSQNMQSRLQHAQFRADLYDRLAMTTLKTPSLRERPEDVGPMAQHFLDEARKDGHTRATSITPPALNMLLKYHWPGNARELKNAIERAIIFEDGLAIQIASLPPDIIRAVAGAQAVPLPKITETYSAEQFKAILSQSNALKDRQVRVTSKKSSVLTMDEEEKRIILRTLAITGGNISEAARRLSVHRSTLHRKMARYGLATEEQLADDAAKSQK